MQSEPRSARTAVWALPVSLAATSGITVVFSSSGYLDVSVHRVPPACLCIQHTVTGSSPAGFPHSDIRGSRDICSSPRLFAAYHVFLRPLVPRHPSCALFCLTCHLSVTVNRSLVLFRDVNHALAFFTAFVVCCVSFLVTYLPVYNTSDVLNSFLDI